ncbi:MAG: hypothetical protein ING44_11670 [Telmatospirillum sp.]|nr:hypothetical protein [Telmatospirillum sp.]
MEFSAFATSTDSAQPPPGLARPVLALWHAKKGDWDAAHKLVQQDEGEKRHDWVHAYLHRVEGDLGNARYWYRRADHPVATGTLEAEWAAIAAALLAEPTPR